MISDTLFDAGVNIDGYLRDLPHVYEGEIREKIERLRRHMREVQNALDAYSVEAGTKTERENSASKGENYEGDQC
jgi:hypothetical protein